MKKVFISVFTNVIICVAILISTFVGFYPPTATEVSKDINNVFYRGKGANNCVSLMFNVYQNTENVYKILEILKENGSTATFFIGGSWADDNVDCVRSIYNNGFEIASHGYFHKDHEKLNLKQNTEEILPSVKLLNMICNTEIELFAPPSGAFSQKTATACASLNLKLIMWSRDTIDWRDQNEKLIYERATKDLTSGEFILMHPTDCTVKTLPKILNYIKENGFITETVSINLGE
ncbi:MAG: polysaccharide deacetylase family protein [Clostridia bacterium]|nr:polysaccharide deacetylase family protein [Clostridia bacterium]